MPQIAKSGQRDRIKEASRFKPGHLPGIVVAGSPQRDVFAVLDFRQNRTVGSASAFRIARRLVMLGLMAMLALLLVMRGRVGREAVQQPEPAELPQARVGQLTSAEEGTVEKIDPRKLFPGVRSDYLDTVRDDTVFRAAESDAWFHLLELLQKTDPAQIATASVGRVGYLQLDSQAASYRGRVVTLDGTVRKAKRLDAPANAYDVRQYYQLWLQPDRAAPELIVVYALELPAGFPEGDALDEAASTTGIFFKRWAYPSQDGIRTAPLVVARTVDWQPAPPEAVKAPAGEQFALAAATAAVIAVLAIAVLAVRSRRVRSAAVDTQQVRIHVPDEVADDPHENDEDERLDS